MRRPTAREMKLSAEERRGLDQEAHAIDLLIPVLLKLRARLRRDELGIASARALSDELFDRRDIRVTPPGRLAREFRRSCEGIAEQTGLEVREVRGLAHSLLDGALDARDAICFCAAKQ